MNFKTCVKCGNKYSDTIKKCPHCGYRPEEKEVKCDTENLFNKKRRFVVSAGVIVVLVIISIFSANEIITSQRIKQLEKEADSFFEQGDYETAIITYKEILSIKDIHEIEDKILECETAIDTIYVNNIILVKDVLQTSFMICSRAYVFTKTVWINRLYREDEYNQGSSNPNKALYNLYHTQEMQNSISALISAKCEVDLQMKNLQNPPNEYTVLYNEIITLYQKYNILYFHVISFPDVYKTYTADHAGHGYFEYIDISEEYIENFKAQSDKVDSLIEIEPMDNISDYSDLEKTDLYIEANNLLEVYEELQKLIRNYHGSYYD